jgi:hypothetical protein
MSFVLEKHLAAPSTGRWSPEIVTGDRWLEISVVFTSVACTLAALKHAAVLADRLHARITLLVPQIVPYPLPLTSPPVLIDWNERLFRVIAEASAVDTTVRVYLCRDSYEALKLVLRQRSRVVVGGRRKWWRYSSEKRLARNLSSAGHEVVFIETE